MIFISDIDILKMLMLSNEPSNTEICLQLYNRRGEIVENYMFNRKVYVLYLEQT